MQARNVDLASAMNHKYKSFVPGAIYSADEVFIFIDAERMVFNGTVVGMPGYQDGFVRVSAPEGPHPRDPVCMGWKGAKTLNYDFENRTFRLLGRNHSDDPIRYLGTMRLIEFTQRVDNDNPASAWFQLEDVTGGNMHILPH